jgi:hypothetical protein
MFEESFLINLVIFLLGQWAAYGYLRTGLRQRGLALMILGWVLVDVILVERYAFERTGIFYRVSLACLQAYSLVEFVLFTGGRIRRRLRSVRRAREVDFRQAFLHYLNDEMVLAEAGYRRILKRDPWDEEATLGLATTLARIGKSKKARAMFRRARALDQDGRFTDVIGDELRRFRPAAPSGGKPAAALDRPALGTPTPSR